ARFRTTAGWSTSRRAGSPSTRTSSRQAWTSWPLNSTASASGPAGRSHRRTRMAGVVNDIEALAEFRAHLLRFNHDLAENFATIQGPWRELGEIWRDAMYRLSGEALEEVTPGIATYLSATEGHEAPLAALIERLSGYLETGAGAGLGVGRPPEVRGGMAGGTGQGTGRRDRN